MKPIAYLGQIFFDLMRIQPRETFYSTSLSLARTMVEIDMEDKRKKHEDFSINEKYLKKLDFIGANTTEELKMPLAIAEAIVASKERQFWGKEYDGKNNDGIRISLKENRNIRVLDIYRLLKEAYTPIVSIVADIIKDYTMEYRMGGSEAGFAPSWLGGNNEMQGSIS